MPGKHGTHQCHTKRGTLKAAIATAVGIAGCLAGLDAATATPAPPPLVRQTVHTSPADVEWTPAAAAREVVRLVNVERAGHGCPPVRRNAALEKAAQRHADDMATRGFFDHTNPDGADPGARIIAAGYSWSSYGENIAVGQATPAAVMRAWMNSPGHRRNILECRSAEIGVGIRFATGGPWWTQDLASPD